MTQGKERLLWSLWVVIFLTLAYLFATNVDVIQWVDLLAFTALTVLTAVMPIKYRSHMLTIFQWVTLVIFLKFGLVIELLITQLALFGALFATGIRKENAYRIPINSLIFFVTSLVAASMFYAVGGQTNQSGSLSTYQDFLAVMVYVVTFLVANHLCIYMGRRFLFGLKQQQVLKGMMIEVATAAIFLPLTLILIISYEQIGLNAIVFAGLSFIGISVVLQLYNRSELTNELFKEVTQFGYELNASLDRSDLLDRLLDKVNKFLQWDQLYVYDVKNEDLSLLHAEDKAGGAVSISMKNGDTYSKQVITSNVMMMANTRKEWGGYGEELASNLESIITIPLKRKEKISGMMTITSRKPHAFKQHQLMTLEIMANMLTIALSNVKSFEKTKEQSEHCQLTNLYNFRYFEDHLKEKLQSDEEHPISLILLDLDHFKRINDTYGHQSGNDVLYEIALRLKNIAPTEAVVARYGGEEFVLLLSHTTEAEATCVARDIWDVLRTTPITIHNDLTTQLETDVIVTASIGVACATVNEEGLLDDATTLIRKADRAMYNGAKQRGRDKVAVFSELKKDVHV
ncbi:sensor domain-containing diguanylate cyclase [Bacillus sp. FJAT-45037]|uniref:sensor domain-containing diguanylate cyclase n=1 Tax=Bacillus sp. FJAT-45037 TaxID=2011007 RepID=UPI000C23A584|nr:sensor domain-containing diguanylate cyclase [Bacillus sp. FJAT-45037]